MTGLQRIARRAIVARLKGFTDLTAIVPAGSIFGQTVPAPPAWPFIKTGAPQTLPISATCLNGGEVAVPVSGFAKDRFTGSLKVETAEDHASRIGAQVEAALHLKGETLTIDGATARLTYRLTDMRLFQDGAEAGAYHYSALVRARVFAE